VTSCELFGGGGGRGAEILCHHIQTGPEAHILGTIFLEVKHLGMKLITEFPPSKVYLFIACLMMLGSCRQLTSGGPPAWALGVGLTTPHHKKRVCYEVLHRASDLD
jgi:hypothetical protein